MFKRLLVVLFLLINISVCYANGIDADTVLMLHCNGTTFTDDSDSNHTITAVNNAQTDTAQKKFGARSGKFVEGATDDYIYADTHSDFDFSSSDFTIDCWARITQVAGKNPTIFSGGTSYCFLLYYDVDADRIVLFLSSDGSNWDIAGPAFGTSSWGFTDQTWYHFALVWDGSDYKAYINGGADITVTDSTGLYGTTQIRVGASHAGSQGMNGWEDEVRVSRVARWTSDFTPPTEEYTREAVAVAAAAIVNFPLIRDASNVGGIGMVNSGLIN